MLQQILQDLWIDPELLDKLDDDQKQTLFCRMREEQVRRWKEWDSEQLSTTAGEERKSSTLHRGPNGKAKPRVEFLMGIDGEPWVWVMGEHPNDKTIEEILEEEAREKARQEAEKEAEDIRKNVTVDLKELLDFNQKQIEALEKDNEDQCHKNEYPLDLYCAVDEFKETARNAIPLNLIPTDGTTDGFQGISISKPKQVAQRIAQWEQRLLEKRTSQIFQRLKDQRKEAAKQAEEAEKKQEKLWKEQERRAKEAELQIREIARRAREEHRRTSLLELDSKKESLQTGSEAIPIMPYSSNCETESLCPTELGMGKPSCKVAIIEWFHKKEIPRRAGLNYQNKVENWFHGLITRAEAEMLMNDKPSGAFLVRVSEKIWGYAITYRENGKCKHYLVDASNEYYKFLGGNHLHHKSLGDLVNYHRLNAITSAGGEILRHECRRLGIPSLYSGVLGISTNESNLKQ
ncbi:SH2 domain-containing protein 4B-like [Hetaerina americana]|uniref:SH2 domain-containing protein 4B-like n=1 Tax=Hetaerina americana TaxID=62018 RepID=UPI003A7F3617